jgi:hypothetical protein
MEIVCPAWVIESPRKRTLPLRGAEIGASCAMPDGVREMRGVRRPTARKGLRRRENAFVM